MSDGDRSPGPTGVERAFELMRRLRAGRGEGPLGDIATKIRRWLASREGRSRSDGAGGEPDRER